VFVWSWMSCRPDFTQELPRKLLQREAKRPKPTTEKR